MKPVREIYLPAPGSAHWQPGGMPQGGLLYMGWGRRFYGRHPIPLRLHHGWTCMVVLSGQPVFLAADRRHRTRRGSVIVAGPDVPYGWEDKPSEASTHLVWIWKEPPTHGGSLSARACWLRNADDEQLAEIEDLHHRTRNEIHRSDDYSPEAIAALKILLETVIARCNGGVMLHGCPRPAQIAARGTMDAEAPRYPLASLRIGRLPRVVADGPASPFPQGGQPLAWASFPGTQNARGTTSPEMSWKIGERNCTRAGLSAPWRLYPCLCEISWPSTFTKRQNFFSSTRGR